MTRQIPILSRLVLCAVLASTASLAHAQQNYGPQGYSPRGHSPSYGEPHRYGPQYGGPQYGGPQNYDPNGYAPQNGPNTNRRNSRNRNNGGDGGGVLPLPEGVSRVVGIDAQNVLLVEMEPQVEGGPSEYRAIPVRHVYVGGIARVFGGETISTEEFVSPAYSKGRVLGQNGNNGPGNFARAGNAPQGFGQGLNNGYNNGFNQGFPNGGLVPNGGFPNGGYPNNGFNANGFNNGVPLGTGFGGGFVGSPQVTFGVGGITQSVTVPGQSTTTTTTTPVGQGR